jgi:glyoxylase-like metal-dependent hydrolase (beta-lactamase superfamily II)
MTQLDRRLILAAPALIGVAALPMPVFAQTAAPAGQAPGFYRYKVGDALVTAVYDGFGSRPLEGFIKNAELPAVQEAMKNAFLPTDKININFTSLVVQTGGKLILLDTGNGEFAAPTAGLWMANFKAAGFDPANVTDIVHTHFHGDHINGTRKKDGTLTFPNAQIHVPSPEWAFWMSDERMAAAPEGMKGAFAGVRRVFGPEKDKVKLYEPGKEVVSGITSVPAYGHTPGHSMLAVSSGNAKFLFVADITNHPALFVRNPDWMAIFDQDGEMARQTRRKVLDMVSADRLQVAFYHAPFPATGHVVKVGNGYDLVPVQWTATL